MRDTILPVFLVIATLCTVWGTADADIADPASKPNIVLIMADDVSWEAFSCYGAEDYKTPHIDALAARGVRFAHCYSTPICTPSRVQIMTGSTLFVITPTSGISTRMKKRSGTSCSLRGIRRRSQESGSSMACTTISLAQTTQCVPLRPGFTNRTCGR